MAKSLAASEVAATAGCGARLASFGGFGLAPATASGAMKKQVRMMEERSVFMVPFYQPAIPSCQSDVTIS
jgi:hypothetical protein